MDFTESQVQRYSRHIILQDVGVEGQIKISEGKVLIVGAGGLGAPVALYLAATGVGTIGIIDGDVVDLTNLQRQVIHFTRDVNKAKVMSAKEKIEQLNPDVKVVTYYELLSPWILEPSQSEKIRNARYAVTMLRLQNYRLMNFLLAI